MFKKSIAVMTLAAMAAACGPAPQPPADPVTPAPAEAPQEQPAPPPTERPAPPPVARVEQPAPRPRPRPRVEHREPAEAPPPVRQVCQDCGVITAVSDERIKGDPSAIGTLGGAAAGGLAGNQFGHKSGKVLATIGGVVLGGLAGREAESQIRAHVVHHVTVAMETGETRNVTVEALAGLTVGSKVRVSGQDLIPNN